MVSPVALLRGWKRDRTVYILNGTARVRKPRVGFGTWPDVFEGSGRWRRDPFRPADFKSADPGVRRRVQGPAGDALAERQVADDVVHSRPDVALAERSASLP